MHMRACSHMYAHTCMLRQCESLNHYSHGLTPPIFYGD